MRYLVTGGAGFIGSNLVRWLAADGHEVRVLDDFSRGRSERLRGVQCDVMYGDIRDPEVASAAVHGVDGVVHLAYLQGTAAFYSEPRQVLDVAMRGMLNLMSACERWAVTDFMLLSSSEAYQVADPVPTPETVRCVIADPLNPRYSYGGGKLACELMLNAWARTGVFDRAIIARPHNVIGPDMGREHVIPQFCIRMNDLVREHPDGIIPFPIQGTGEETRSFCFIDDCVEQLALLLGSVPDGQHIYHVGAEDEVTIARLAHEVAACYGREVKVLPGTLPKGSPPRRLPDTSKLRSLVPGYLPSVAFAEAVKRTAGWYRSHG